MRNHLMVELLTLAALGAFGLFGIWMFVPPEHQASLMAASLPIMMTFVIWVKSDGLVKRVDEMHIKVNGGLTELLQIQGEIHEALGHARGFAAGREAQRIEMEAATKTIYTEKPQPRED